VRQMIAPPQGRKVGAIYHYRDATGVDLTIAVAVVKAIGTKNQGGGSLRLSIACQPASPGPDWG
jgi:hypothetical protein